MPTVRASKVPMYLQGNMAPFLADPEPAFYGSRVRASKIPMYQQGFRGYGSSLGLGVAKGIPAINPGVIGPWTILGPAVVSKTGGAVSSMLLSASQGAAQGMAVGGPIGAGIGALAGAIAGLWASHAARTKGAKAENDAINSAVQTFDAGIKAIFAAANSSDPTQNITGAQAAATCQSLLQQFFQVMAPFTHGPGAADSSNGGTNCGSGVLNPAGACAGTEGGHKCDSSCTATCCVGCQDLYPTVLQAAQVFASPQGGAITVCGVVGSKYGAVARGSYSLTYTPPVISAIASGSAVPGASLLPASVSTALDAPVAGFPLWMILAAGAGAFFLLR